MRAAQVDPLNRTRPTDERPVTAGDERSSPMRAGKWTRCSTKWTRSTKWTAEPGETAVTTSLPTRVGGEQQRRPGAQRRLPRR